MAKINTVNSQGVGLHGIEVVIMIPKSKEEALRHAAYLVAIASMINDKCPTFEDILEAVENNTLRTNIQITG